MTQKLVAAIVLLVAGWSGAAHAALPPALHAYGLNASLDDELGGSSMTALGGKLGSMRFRFLANEGLGLQGAVPTAGYSIELKLLPFETSGWRRLIDFKNRQSDTGLYIHDGHTSFVSTEVTDSAQVVFQSGVSTDLLVTRDAETGLLRVYVGGVLAQEIADTAGTAVFATDEGGISQAWFFADDFAFPNEATGGSVEHVRVFDHPLSAKNAAALSKGKLPPNVTQE